LDMVLEKQKIKKKEDRTILITYDKPERKCTQGMVISHPLFYELHDNILQPAFELAHSGLFCIRSMKSLE
jgi:hypothetical protein